MDIGSSPLTRGKRLEAAVVLLVLRLIPAHAGKTSWRRSRIARASAHPRSRGENCSRTRSASALGGSSPLTRGKPVTCTDARSSTRLIPAHAGKTRPRRMRTTAIPAHPRSRGENAGWEHPAAGIDGSSPLTRGKLACGDPQ